jgi:hypothetical protein
MAFGDSAIICGMITDINLITTAGGVNLPVGIKLIMPSTSHSVSLAPPTYAAALSS